MDRKLAKDIEAEVNPKIGTTPRKCKCVADRLELVYDRTKPLDVGEETELTGLPELAELPAKYVSSDVIQDERGPGLQIVFKDAESHNQSV